MHGGYNTGTQVLRRALWELRSHIKLHFSIRPLTNCQMLNKMPLFTFVSSPIKPSHRGSLCVTLIPWIKGQGHKSWALSEERKGRTLEITETIRQLESSGCTVEVSSPSTWLTSRGGKLRAMSF